MRLSGSEFMGEALTAYDEHQRKPQLNVHMFPNFVNIPDIEKHPDA